MYVRRYGRRKRARERERERERESERQRETERARESERERERERESNGDARHTNMVTCPVNISGFKSKISNTTPSINKHEHTT